MKPGGEDEEVAEEMVREHLQAAVNEVIENTDIQKIKALIVPIGPG